MLKPDGTLPTIFEVKEKALRAYSAEFAKKPGLAQAERNGHKAKIKIYTAAIELGYDAYDDAALHYFRANQKQLLEDHHGALDDYMHLFRNHPRLAARYYESVNDPEAYNDPNTDRARMISEAVAMCILVMRRALNGDDGACVALTHEIEKLHPHPQGNDRLASYRVYAEARFREKYQR